MMILIISLVVISDIIQVICLTVMLWSSDNTILIVMSLVVFLFVLGVVKLCVVSLFSFSPPPVVLRLRLVLPFLLILVRISISIRILSMTISAALL